MGSDELFAGHSRYSLQEISDHYLYRAFRFPFNWIKRALIPIFTIHYKPIAYQLARQARAYPPQFDYLEQNALFDENEMRAASLKMGSIFDPEIFLHKFNHIHRVKSKVASYLYFDVKTRLVDCYTHQYERLTAAHALDSSTLRVYLSLMH